MDNQLFFEMIKHILQFKLNILKFLNFKKLKMIIEKSLNLIYFFLIVNNHF